MDLIKYEDLKNNFLLNENGPGFHGDIYLINFISPFLKESKNFIETGTNLGNTLFFVSRNFDLNCFSCEVGGQTPYSVINFKNIFFSRIPSPKFLEEISNNFPEIKKDICTFWLDAHFNGGENIIYEEINFILKNFEKFYIFCDDINIENPLFTNNNYNINKIKQQLYDNCNLFIPNYNEQTSHFHKLTGWCLITNQEISYNTQFVKKF